MLAPICRTRALGTVSPMLLEIEIVCPELAWFSRPEGGPPLKFYSRSGLRFGGGGVSAGTTPASCSSSHIDRRCRSSADTLVPRALRAKASCRQALEQYTGIRPASATVTFLLQLAQQMKRGRRSLI